VNGIFAGDSSGFLKNFDGPLYDIIGTYDGKFYKNNEDYSHLSPSSTDKKIFGENNLKISIYDLKKLGK
jgi:hypothetical protein